MAADWVPLTFSGKSDRARTFFPFSLSPFLESSGRKLPDKCPSVGSRIGSLPITGYVEIARLSLGCA